MRFAIIALTLLLAGCGGGTFAVTETLPDVLITATAPQERPTQWLMFTFQGCVICEGAKADFRQWLERSKWEVSPSPMAHVRLVDAELEADLASQFAVKEFPTFVLLVDGKEVKRYLGYPGRDRLVNEYMTASANRKASR